MNAPGASPIESLTKYVSSIEEQLKVLHAEKLTITASLRSLQTECKELKQQNNNLWKRNDALERSEFEAVNAGNSLAEKLGFANLHEALGNIASVVDVHEQQRLMRRHDGIIKKLGVERLEDLETLLAEPIDLKQLLSGDKGPLQDIPLALASRASNSPYSTPTKPKKHTQPRSGPIPPPPAFATRSPPSHSPTSKRQVARLEDELAATRAKYTELEKKWERSKEIYKRDFAGWRRYRNWIFGENDIDGLKEPKAGIIDQNRLTLAREVGPVVADQNSKSILMSPTEQGADEKELLRGRVLVPGIPGYDFELETENQNTRKQEPLSSSATKKAQNGNDEGDILVPASDDAEIPDPLPPSDEPSPDTDPDTPIIPSSQTEYESMVPLDMMSFFRRPRPVMRTTNLNDHQSSPSPPSPSLGSRKDSSETEEESQAMPMPAPPATTQKPKPNQVPQATPTPSTSIQPLALPTPVTMARPLRRGAMKPKPAKWDLQSSSSGEVEFVDTPVFKKPVLPPAKRAPNATQEESRKKRRVSEELAISDDEDIDISLFASASKAPAKPAATENDEPTPVATGKGKEKEKYPAGYDYSVHKGRGRYARSKPDEREEAQYEIDPNKNNGMDFEYDEVVRNKRDRAKMLAGECMECAEYYANVGPYPPRLQPPLFRSPSPPSSPSQSSSTTHHPKCSHHHNQERVAQEHRQKISRHRAHFEKAKTPPGYWEIGFPSTQEVERINEEAKEMHRQKKDKMGKDNRYRKR